MIIASKKAKANSTMANGQEHDSSCVHSFTFPLRLTLRDLRMANFCFRYSPKSPPPLSFIPQVPRRRSPSPRLPRSRSSSPRLPRDCSPYHVDHDDSDSSEDLRNARSPSPRAPLKREHSQIGGSSPTTVDEDEDHDGEDRESRTASEEAMPEKPGCTL